MCSPVPSIPAAFFFHLFGRNPDLHSFPTRRSSDLPTTRRYTVPEMRIQFMDYFADNGHARSEEHTSELQSHHDLVCRLLLDKKKKPTPLACALEDPFHNASLRPRHTCRSTLHPYDP